MKRRIILILWLFVIVGTLWAQTIKVAGVVTSTDDGSPLIGAAVKVMGQNAGTVTDAQGHFSLTAMGDSAQLEFSYLGFDSKIVNASSKGQMHVSLSPTSELLDEVMIVAFGKQKRESFTGAASVVSSEKLSAIQVNNPLEALNGQVSGVLMTMNNDIVSDPNIRVRGISSINAGNAPLIIVDGLPFNGYYSDLNPNDLESITVLKDASSNALYGARGANGVILITTKQAKKGRTKVLFNARVGCNQDARVDYDYITDPGQYMEAHYQALYNYYVRAKGQSAFAAHQNANASLGKSASEGGIEYVPFTVPNGEYLVGENGRLNPKATQGRLLTDDSGRQFWIQPDNWRDYGLRNGMRQEYNVNITGGESKQTFMASMGYFRNEGLSYGSDVERITARLKTDYDAFDWLKLAISSSYTHTTTNSSNSVFDVVHSIAPIYPLFMRDGNKQIMQDSHGARYDYGDGSVAGLNRLIDQNANSIQSDKLDLSENTSNAFNLQGYADFTLTKDLKLTINSSVYVTENKFHYTTNPYYGYNATTQGYVSSSHYRTTDTNYQQLLNYGHEFGRHNVSAMLGHEYSRSTQTSLGANKTHFAMFESNNNLDGAITNGSIDGSESMYNVEGWFFRALYDYDGRWFLNTSFRRDASSRFHPDHRWGNFWSLGGAWIISRESWWHESPILTMMKIKSSYGEQGNDNIGSFLYTDQYTIESVNDEVAYIFSSKGNKTITWETVGSFNAGLEFELLKGRVSGDIEYYSRKTSDMLMWFTVPYNLGYSGYYDNIGDMTNRGIELDFSVHPYRNKYIDWAINGNMTWQYNRISMLPEGRKGKTAYRPNGEAYHGYQSSYLFYGENLPMRSWYLKDYAGVNEEGLSTWYRTDKDGQRVATTDFDAADYYLCGSALAKLFGGFGSTVNAYGADFSINFVYSIGGKQLDYGYMQLMTPPMVSSTGSNYHKDIFKAWSEQNTSSQIPRWQYADESAAYISSRFLTDASYLSLSSISLGYTMPKKWMERMKIQKMRIYCTADNVAYWTARDGFDPRNSTTYSYGTGYHPIRTISGGIQVEF